MEQTVSHSTFQREENQKILPKILFLILLGLLSNIAQGQITYTWKGTLDNDWTKAGNWLSAASLPRTTPLPTDVLVFNNGGPVNIINVPVQSLGQLFVNNNTLVNLSAQPVVAPATTILLTIAGGSGADLQVAAGSELNITGSNSLIIRLLTGATASISGKMTFTAVSALHVLDAIDTGAILFNNGAIFTQNCNGYAFSSGGTNGSVMFASGSKFISQNGGSPFGAASTNAIVTFQSGSLYSHQQSASAPSLSGRTYGDFEMNSNSYDRWSTATGGSVWTVDNLIVTSTGTTNGIGFGIDLTGGITIKGNIIVNGGILNFGPKTSGTVNTITFNGTGTQSIGGTGGTILMASSTNGNTNVVVPNGKTLEIQRACTIGGSLTVEGSLQYSNVTAQVLSVNGNLSGGGRIDMSGGNFAHVLNLGGATNAISTFTTSATGSSTVNYNASSDQQVFASANYQNLTISGSGTKTLMGTTKVNGTFRLQSGSLQVAANSLVVSGNSFISGMLAMNSKAGTADFQNVDLSGGQLGGGPSPQDGTVTINGNCLINTGEGVINVVNLMVKGNMEVVPGLRSFQWLTINSSAGSKTFNNFTVHGWGGFRNTSNAAVTITGNMSISNTYLNFGSDIYTFTGTTGTITSKIATPLTIPNATFKGSYTATGTNLVITNPLVSPGGKFTNNTDAFPTILPGSTAFRAFNNQTLAFFNKFDAVAASNNNGNSVTANNTDFAFTLNGAGGVYAVRNSKVLNPAPTAVMVTFQLEVTNNGTATPNAAALFIGDNLGDTPARPGVTSAISLQIDLTTSNTAYTWVVNRSGTVREYNSPSGMVRTLANNSSDLWQGTTFVGNSSFPATFTPTSFKQVKFVMDGGNGVIKLQNLKINPLATITTTANTCYTAGYNFNVNYTLNEYTTAALTTAQTGGVVNRAQSLNEGNEMRVQLSDASGNFDLNINNNIIGRNNVVASGSVSLNGSIQAQIPPYALGSGYRYRVIATDILISNSANSNNTTTNANQMAYVRPGNSQSLPAYSATAGVQLTAHAPSGATGVSYQWGYRTTSGSGFTSLGTGSAFTGQNYTPVANTINSGTPGTYYIVCRMNYTTASGSCAGFVSNEVIIYLNCNNPGGVNLIKNGTFDDDLTGSITIPKNSANIDGTATKFTQELRVGRKLYDANNTLIGTISSIQSDTQLTLASKTPNTNSYPYSTRYSTNYAALWPETTGYLNTGTITVNANATTVSGVGTQFSSELKVGDIIRLSNNNAATIQTTLGTVASITSNTQLTLVTGATMVANGANFIANPPAFGNTGMGFDTYYYYSSTANGLYPEGYYAIGTNPNNYHSAFCNMPTSPTSSSIGGSGGNVLVANGTAGTTQIVWEQLLSGLTPGQNYILTFNAASLAGPTNSLVFGMYINCNRVGEDITNNYNSSNCVWNKYSIQVNTGTLTSFKLGIANISSAANGNDVAIDDIQLYPCSNTTVIPTPFSPVNKFVWRGFNTNWFDSDNWGVCPGVYPTCGDDVTIPADMPNYPIINADGPNGLKPVARKVTIDPEARLTINPGFNLNICGDLNNTGTINALTNAGSPSSISFIGYGSAITPPSPLPTKQTITTTSVSPFMNVVIHQNPVMADGVSLNTDATINGQLDIRYNTAVNKPNTLQLNGKTLTLNGTLSSNLGTITGSPSSGMVVGGSGDITGPLRFTTPATSSSTEQTLGFLHMKRASGGKLTLGTPLKLQSGVLRLDNGIIYTSLTPVAPSTSAPIFTLDASSTVTGGGSYLVADPLRGKSGGTDLSHIDGPMAKITNSGNSFIFPVGNIGFLGEIGITPNPNATAATQTTYVGRYVRQSAYTVGTDVEKPPLDHVSHMEYWTLDRPFGGASGKVTLHWTSYSIVSQVSTERNELRIARYSGASPSGITSLGGPMWENQGGITVGGENSYNFGHVTTNTDVNLFGAFTLASTIPNNPLPVELVSLKATPTQEGQVKLNWITASEHNNSHFLVQHSTDGKFFRTIGRVQAQGESVSGLTYGFVHTSPAPFNYYRLSIIDKDASSSLSSTVTARLQGTALSAPFLYPNPNDGKQLFVRAICSDKVTVSITSLVGVEVFRQRIMPQQGLLSLRPNLPPGTYLVTLKEGNRTTHIKLIVK